MKRSLLGLSLILSLALLPALVPAGTSKGGQRLALLVGTTKYDYLAENLQLIGPGNDVKLTRKLLQDHFQFPAASIVTLSEEAGQKDPKLRPARAHIEREFKRLAQVANKGDIVLIALGGHGTQQPDQPPGDPNQDEHDGLDEVYLPCDTQPWDGKTIKNGIIDDELKAWTRAITERGASVFVIFDCCHSGTLLRDVGVEVKREVGISDKGVFKGDVSRTQALVPEEAVSAAVERARKSPPQAPPGVGAFSGLGQGVDLVALYAAQPIEPTYERPMPPEGEKRERHGLFTYTICQVLMESHRPLTCREVIQQVQARYTGWGRYYPTPLIEGSNLDREFLGRGSFTGRSRINLEKNASNEWIIDAGQLSGLSEGSILAVYPAAGQPNDDRVTGHVKITRSEPYEAVVEPCAHGKVPVNAKLPEGGRCTPVEVTLGLLRTRIALDRKGSPKVGKAKWQTLAETLKKATERPETLAQEVADVDQATWLVQIEKGQAYLVPVDAARVVKDQPRNTTILQGRKRFGPLPLDDVDKLAEKLGQIGRAQNLLRLAGSGAEEVARGNSTIDVKLELLASRQGQPLTTPDKAAAVLQPGDKVAFKVTNVGREPADVTLLFVDGGLGIQALFPPRPGVDNRLYPRESYTTGTFTITQDTVGLEHTTLIAVKGVKQNRDFSWLAQPSLPRAEKTRGVREGSTGLTSLFNHALYSEGTARGLTAEAATNHAMRLLSWRVQAK